MERSEIRERRSSLSIVPGLRGACHRAGHFGPDPLAPSRLRPKCLFATCVFPFSRCAVAPELCLTPPKAFPKNSSLERREAERQKAHLGAASQSDAARTLSPVLLMGGPRPLATSWSGRARLSAPHRGTYRGFILGSAQAALPGITGCKREDPLRHQCSEHLAVRTRAGRDDAQAARERSVSLHSREPLPLRLKEYPRERRPSRAGWRVCNCNRDVSQGQCLFIRDTP
jgi:hypothetical protein